jgi:Subtilisin-like serine proteases
MGRHVINIVVLFIIVLAVFSPIVTAIGSASESSVSKIHPALLKRLAQCKGDELVEVVVRLKPLPREVAQQVRGRHSLAVSTLMSWASLTQEPVVKWVESNGGVVLSRFWLDNVILIRISAKLVVKLAENPDVVKLFENFEVRVLGPVAREPINVRPGQGVSSWGVFKIRANEVWALGITGQGIRIAVLDTGVDITHPALEGKMLSVIPDDPYYPGGWMEFDIYGNPVRSTPHDTHGHGTHVSGTALGGDTENILIGVAPGATLMHGLILPGGFGSFAQVLAGMEWAVNPYYLTPDGEKVYTGLPAHVVSMSFGATEYYGNELLPAIEAMLLTNIVPVAAIGNSGPGTTANPGNIWGVLGVGATDMYDNVAWFSSGNVVQWPSPPPAWPFFDMYPSVYVKPDLSAPGVMIVSAVPGGGYEAWDGTSMATPHVSGTVALMLQAAGWFNYEEPDIPEKMYLALNSTALDFGDPGQDIRYGWGRIDAYEAVSKALEYAKKSGVEGVVLDQETLEPVPWARVTVVETGRTYSVSSTGGFRIPLDPGTYTLVFSAWGYEDVTETVEVVNDTYTQVAVLMPRLPYGFVTGRAVGSDGLVLAGARVAAMGTPIARKTNETGHFYLWLPEGSYTLSISYPGYKTTLVDVTVKQSAVVDVGTVVLKRLPRVAVVWDYAGALKRFFESREWYAADYTGLTQLTSDILAGRYDAVIYAGYYGAPYPSLAEFSAFLSAAYIMRVGVVWMDSYGDFGYGIKVLNSYLNDPPIVGFSWGCPVYIRVTEPHPVLRGYKAGDVIPIITLPYADFSWFYGFSGEAIANTVACGNEVGNAVAWKVLDNGAKWVLLSSFAPTQLNTPDLFTSDAWNIIYNAVVWSASKPLNVSLENPYLHVGDTAALHISGAPANTTLYVYLDGQLLDTVKTDESGTATLEFVVPLMPGGKHFVEAYTEDMMYYGYAVLHILVKVVASPESITAPGAVYVEVTGLQPYQQVYIYLDGNYLSLHKANVSGAFSIGKLNIPLVESGSHTILVVDPVSGGILGNATILVDSKLDTAMLKLVQLDVALAKLDQLLANAEKIGLRIDAVLNETVYVKTKVGAVEVKLADLLSALAKVNATLRELVIEKTGEIYGVIQTAYGNITVGLDALKALLNNKLPVDTNTLMITLRADLKSLNETTTAKVNEVLRELGIASNTITAKLDTSLTRLDTSLSKLDEIFGKVSEVSTNLSESSKKLEDSIKNVGSSVSTTSSYVLATVGLSIAVLALLAYLGFVRRR